MAGAVVSGRVVEAAVGATPRVEVGDERRREVVGRQAEQLAAGEGGELGPEDGISVLFVLREVGRRAGPAADLFAERRGVLAEPEQALDLLIIEFRVFLLQLLQLPG